MSDSFSIHRVYIMMGLFCFITFVSVLLFLTVDDFIFTLFHSPEEVAGWRWHFMIVAREQAALPLHQYSAWRVTLTHPPYK